MMDESDRAMLRSLNYEARSVLEGPWGSRRAWASLWWDGLVPDESWGILPDGRDVSDVLVAGDLHPLPPVWLRVRNTGTYADILWTTSMVGVYVSDRFVSALQDAGFDGFQLLPLQVQPKRGERLSGYSLLLPDNSPADAPIRSFPFTNRASSSLDVSAEVLAALTAASATDLRVRSSSKAVESLLAPDDFHSVVEEL